MSKEGEKTEDHKLEEKNNESLKEILKNAPPLTFSRKSTTDFTGIGDQSKIGVFEIEDIDENYKNKNQNEQEIVRSRYPSLEEKQDNVPNTTVEVNNSNNNNKGNFFQRIFSCCSPQTKR